jgi:hypothetical protein
MEGDVGGCKPGRENKNVTKKYYYYNYQSLKNGSNLNKTKAINLLCDFFVASNECLQKKHCYQQTSAGCNQ